MNNVSIYHYVITAPTKPPRPRACALGCQQEPRRWNMATYVDILKSEFPEIDTEVFDYITGESLVMKRKALLYYSCAETAYYKVYIVMK